MTVTDGAAIVFFLAALCFAGALLALVKRSWRSRGLRILKPSAAALVGSFVVLLATVPSQDGSAPAAAVTTGRSEAATRAEAGQAPRAPDADARPMTSAAVDVQSPPMPTTAPVTPAARATTAPAFTKAERQLDLPALLKDCPAGNEACLSMQKAFRDEYAAAFKRKYTSQRNIAYMLEDRDSHGQIGVVHNWIAACAWRAVILNSRHADVDASDRSNLDFACRRLNPPGKAAAAIMAGELMGKIYQRPLATGFMFP